MENKPVTYRIKHVGINNPNEEEARRSAALLCALFGLEETLETPAAIFAGDIFEVMKHDRLGRCGHVAMQTEDVEAAMAQLAARGVAFDEKTIRRDENGKIKFIYLRDEYCGFRFHLTT